MIEIPKVWGKELILVNEPEYASKILVINKGAGSSWHRHKVKKETFVCLKGKVKVYLEDQIYHLFPFQDSLTIPPSRWHQFHGVEDSETLEVSTRDAPEDTERRTSSYRGSND